MGGMKNILCNQIKSMFNFPIDINDKEIILMENFNLDDWIYLYEANKNHDDDLLNNCNNFMFFALFMLRSLRKPKIKCILINIGWIYFTCICFLLSTLTSSSHVTCMFTLFTAIMAND